MFKLRKSYTALFFALSLLFAQIALAVHEGDIAAMAHEHGAQCSVCTFEKNLTPLAFDLSLGFSFHTSKPLISHGLRASLQQIQHTAIRAPPRFIC